MREMFLERVGVDVASSRGGPAEARAAYADAVRKMAPALGCDFSEMNESQMCDDFHYTLFPNVTFNIHVPTPWLFRHRPHPSDPQKMYFDFYIFMQQPGPGIVEGTLVPGGKVFLADADNFLVKVHHNGFPDAVVAKHLAQRGSFSASSDVD